MTRRVRHARRPARLLLEQLGSGDADDRQRGVEGALEDPGHDVDRGLIRPLEVVDHHDDGPAVGDRPEVVAQAARKLARQLRATDVGEHVRSLGESEQDRERSTNPRSIPVVREEGVQASVQPRHDLRPRRCRRDVEVGLDHLHEGPPRDPGAVREAAPAEHCDVAGLGLGRDGPARDPGQELADEAGLADARRAHDREQLCPAVVARPLERVAQQPQLAGAADESGAHRRQAARLLRNVAPGAESREPRDRIRLPARVHRRARFVVDRRARQLFGERPDDDLAGLCVLLQPCRDVHDVAGDEELLPLVERGDSLAGVHAAARLEAERLLLVQRLQRVADRERRADRSLRVVVVQPRDPEDDHDRVADVLLDGPAVSLGDLADSLEVAPEDRADHLGVVVVAECRRADEVDEEDADQPSFLRHGRSLGRQGRTASTTPGSGASCPRR